MIYFQNKKKIHDISMTGNDLVIFQGFSDFPSAVGTQSWARWETSLQMLLLISAHKHFAHN